MGDIHDIEARTTGFVRHVSRLSAECCPPLCGFAMPMSLSDLLLQFESQFAPSTKLDCGRAYDERLPRHVIAHLRRTTKQRGLSRH